MVRLGIFGAGLMTDFYAEAVKKVDDCKIIAVGARNENRGKELAGRLGAAYYEDYTELLDKEKGIDGIINCLPNFLHFESCSAAIDAGVDKILCEKPMTNLLDDSERLLNKVRESGILYQQAYMKRYNPGFARIRETADKLGNIQFISSTQYESGAANRVSPRDLSPWKHDYKLSGGGHLTNAGSHHMDLIRSVFGEVSKVSCKLRFDNEGDPEYSADARMTLESGVNVDIKIGRIDIPNLGPHWKPFKGGWNESIEVIGDLGYIRVDNPTWEGLQPVEVTEWFKGMPGPVITCYDSGDQWRNQLESFIKCCKTGELDQNASTAEDAYRIDYILSKMRQSDSEKGKEIML